MSEAVSDYIENAINRINTGKIASEAGSHIAGVFGIAAQKYEEFMRNKLSEYLETCRLNYNKDITLYLSTKVPFNKLTLGMISKCFEIIADKHANLVRNCLLHIRPEEIQSLIERMNEINSVWVGIKHYGKTITKQTAISNLKRMRETIATL